MLQHINIGSRIDGIARQDYYELPITTIREMISNAACHRSYLTPGKIQVALFDDRLEVTSPGMLDNEITIEKMKTGLSKIRNKGIAAAFSYMNIVEAWGSGIPKMFREAKEYGLREPKLLDMGSDFRVNLYRKAAAVGQTVIVNPAQSGTIRHNPAQSGTAVLPDQELKIIQYVKSYRECTTASVSKLLEVKGRRARTLLSNLVKKKMLKKSGSARKTVYLAGDAFPKLE